MTWGCEKGGETRRCKERGEMTRKCTGRRRDDEEV